MIEASDLRKAYGDVQALDGLGFAVAPARSSACSAPTAPASRRP
jgi:hypothetical protein